MWCAHFGSLIAVNGVSLKVEPGDLHAVIGPNGAGKTTFFNLISGFFPPSSSRIRFRRHATSPPQPAHQRVALGMARTFRSPRNLPRAHRVRERARSRSRWRRG